MSFPIFRYTASDQGCHRGGNRPTISQFPLTPAFCITGHKTQGQTMNDVKHFRPHPHSPQRHALSRRAPAGHTSSLQATNRFDLTHQLKISFVVETLLA
jgi:hypothetical protein